MTCIVGIEHGGKVTIGGDSAGISGLRLSVRSDKKVFRNGPYLIGGSGSFRLLNVLHYRLNVPAQDERHDHHQHMCVTFIDAVREAVRGAGALAVRESVESIEGSFLVGYQGSLYSVHADLQVGMARDGYAAVGCGEDFALGSLATSTGSPRRRVERALEVAEYFSTDVAGPFTIKTLPGSKG